MTTQYRSATLKTDITPEKSSQPDVSGLPSTEDRALLQQTVQASQPTETIKDERPNLLEEAEGGLKKINEISEDNNISGEEVGEVLSGTAEFAGRRISAAVDGLKSRWEFLSEKGLDVGEETGIIPDGKIEKAPGKALETSWDVSGRVAKDDLKGGKELLKDLEGGLGFVNETVEDGIQEDTLAKGTGMFVDFVGRHGKRALGGIATRVSNGFTLASATWRGLTKTDDEPPTQNA